MADKVVMGKIGETEVDERAAEKKAVYDISRERLKNNFAVVEADKTLAPEIRQVILDLISVLL